MKLSILLLSLFLIQPVLANSLLETTAILALKTAKDSPTGTTLEHGGMIYGHPSDSGPIVEFMEPTPGGSSVAVRVVNLDLLKSGDILLATYHLHLCMTGYYHALFSTQDVIAAILTGVPEFMLDECTGEVHELDLVGLRAPFIAEKIHETGHEAKLFGSDCEKIIRILPAGK